MLDQSVPPWEALGPLAAPLLTYNCVLSARIGKGSCRIARVRPHRSCCSSWAAATCVVIDVGDLLRSVYTWHVGWSAKSSQLSVWLFSQRLQSRCGASSATSVASMMLDVY
jgi:hypothetical protein